MNTHELMRKSVDTLHHAKERKLKRVIEAVTQVDQDRQEQTDEQNQTDRQPPWYRREIMS